MMAATWRLSDAVDLESIMTGRLLFALSFVALAAGLSAAAEPAKSVYFRSDLGLAANDKQALPNSFDEKKAQLWRTPIAAGHSTPCVQGDSIFLTTFDSGKLGMVALERATGKVRWTKPVPAKKIEEVHASGSPATATPAADGERVVFFFGSYGFLCYDHAGKLLWSREMGPFQDEFGAASSPLLVDGKVILNEDHDVDSFLACFDAKTGEPLWRTPRPDAVRSYSTPVVWTAGNRKTLVVTGALQLTGYDLANGRHLWTLPGLARIANTTPAQGAERLIVSTWSPGGDPDSRISMEAWDVAQKMWDKNNDGKLALAEVSNKEVLDRFFRIDINQDKTLDKGEWEKYAKVFELARNSVMALKPGSTELSAPEMVWEYGKAIPYVASPLLYRDVVWLVKDGGVLTTLDAKNGELIKSGRLPGGGNYFASPVAGDGKVFFASDKGSLTILQAVGEWEVIATRELGERCVATPVVADGRLFIRSEKAIYCFEPKAE